MNDENEMNREETGASVSSPSIGNDQTSLRTTQGGRGRHSRSLEQDSPSAPASTSAVHDANVATPEVDGFGSDQYLDEPAALDTPVKTSHKKSVPYSKHAPVERDIDAHQARRISNTSPQSLERVHYMNGDALSRPLTMPAKYKRLSVILVILAALIGGAFIVYFMDHTYNAPIREKQTMEERLSTEIPLDLPDMAALLPMDNATILSTLQSSNKNIYVKSNGEGSTPLEIIKLPEDVDMTEAAAMYLTGINKLSASQAALLLNGSWNFSLDRSRGTNMSIHYADFTSKTVSSAIQNAMEAENLTDTEMAESGMDDSGNTFASGNLTVGETTYAWRISALPLSKVYSISGLPEDTVYVGIRITS